MEGTGKHSRERGRERRIVILSGAKDLLLLLPYFNSKEILSSRAKPLAAPAIPRPQTEISAPKTCGPSPKAFDTQDEALEKAPDRPQSAPAATLEYRALHRLMQQ